MSQNVIARIASSYPYYVQEIRYKKNEIAVGGKEELFSKRVEAESFEWIGEITSKNVIEAQAQIRYRNFTAPGRLGIIFSDRVRFILDDPQWAFTPGQVLFCYQGDRELGSR